MPFLNKYYLHEGRLGALGVLALEVEGGRGDDHGLALEGVGGLDGCPAAQRDCRVEEGKFWFFF